MKDDDELLNSLHSNRAKKTDILCEFINIFSLIPTLAYNIFWFFYFRSLLENTPDTEIASCSDINRWVNYSVTWVIISTIKALFFLCCVKICFGSENDCNICCLIMKALTSLIVSILFILNIPDYLDSSYKPDTTCFNQYKALSLFYKCEYVYILFILSLFCLIPFGAFIMGLKEYIKSRSYKLD